MALNKTVADMKHLMSQMMKDIEKAEKGNQAAGQRVRTNSVRFAKVAKVFRKESVAEAKKDIKRAVAKKKTVKRKK